MNIKRRLDAMEQKLSSEDYLIVFFQTFFEAKEGGIDGEVWNATIVTGPHAGAFVARKSTELFDEFQARCDAVSKGEVGQDAACSVLPASGNSVSG